MTPEEIRIYHDYDLVGSEVRRVYMMRGCNDPAVHLALDHIEDKMPFIMVGFEVPDIALEDDNDLSWLPLVGFAQLAVKEVAK